MIIMALDHTRDFFHFDAFLHDPLDPVTSTPVLFFTRWVTHFCAPVFVFLAGTSIFLQSMRKSGSELTGFLLKRGLWLVIVELFIITFAWTFDFTFSDFILGVIWAIGSSMILMALLIRLPFRVIMVTGLLIVLFHNLFDFAAFSEKGIWWDLLRNGNFAEYPLFTGSDLNIIYPVVPWLGLMIMGYCFGKVFSPEVKPADRKRMLYRGGALLIFFFVIMRWLNFYGDPDPWNVQHTVVASFMAFMDVQKYPPSLLYMCITIGPALIFLALFERSNGVVSRIVQVYGRVPFLYYVLHFYVLHTLSMVLFVSRGHSITEATPDIFGIPFRFILTGEGYSLSVVYLIWILLVASLYPVCKWFSELKKRNKSWWLSYL